MSIFYKFIRDIITKLHGGIKILPRVTLKPWTTKIENVRSIGFKFEVRF